MHTEWEGTTARPVARSRQLSQSSTYQTMVMLRPWTVMKETNHTACKIVVLRFVKPWLGCWVEVTEHTCCTSKEISKSEQIWYVVVWSVVLVIATRTTQMRIYNKSTTYHKDILGSSQHRTPVLESVYVTTSFCRRFLLMPPQRSEEPCGTFPSSVVSSSCISDLLNRRSACCL